MNLRYDSRIAGEFSGWNGDTVFELDNGTKWKQARYQYTYSYKYRPRAQIFQQGGQYLLAVDGMNEMIEVRQL